jgi:hypothetical protein
VTISKGKVKMNTFFKSGLVAAVVGLGVFASAGSAYAAGCLAPDQANISLNENSSKAQDAATYADAKGFRCDVVGSELSVRQPTAKATASVSYQAGSKETATSIFTGN